MLEGNEVALYKFQLIYCCLLNCLIDTELVLNHFKRLVLLLLMDCLVQTGCSLHHIQSLPGVEWYKI